MLFTITGNTGPVRPIASPQRVVWRTIPVAAIVALLSIAAAPESRAVECSNGGEGPNPAGDDGAVDLNTACGYLANASGASSTNAAFGLNANAAGANSYNTAIGPYAGAVGASSRNTAIGRSATANGASGINIAIGFGARADEDNGRNIAIGHQSLAWSLRSVAIGDTARANRNSVSGDPNGDNAIAIGTEALAYKNSSIAAGRKASASAAFAVALGAGSKARGNRSVALGHKSVARANDTVSVGAKDRKRRIVHVGNAVNGTDAVNLRQVKALIKAAKPLKASSASPDFEALRKELAQLRYVVATQQALLVRQRIDRIADGGVEVANAM